MILSVNSVPHELVNMGAVSQAQVSACLILFSFKDKANCSKVGDQSIILIATL